MVVTANAESGFDSGEAARETATTSKVAGLGLGLGLGSCTRVNFGSFNFG